MIYVFTNLVAATFDILSISLLFPLVSIVVSGNESFNFFGYEISNFRNLIFLFVVLITLKQILYLFIFKYQSYFVYDIKEKILNKLNESIHNQKYLKLLRLNKNDYITICTEETNNIIQKFLTPVLNIITESILLIGIFVFIIYLHVKSVIFFIAISMPIFFLYKFYFKNNLKTFGAVKSKNEYQRLRLISNFFGNLEIFKLIDNRDLIKEDYQNTIKNITKMESKNLFFSQIPKIIIEQTFIIIAVISFLYLRPDTILDYLPLLTTLAYLFVRILPMLSRIFATLSHLDFSNKPFLNIQEFLNNHSQKKSEIFKKINFKEFQSENAKLTLICKNINFKYSNKAIISNFNYTFKSGDCIRINGASGAGKSTLIKIITRLIDEYDGEIYLNGMLIPRKTYIENLFSMSPKMDL